MTASSLGEIFLVLSQALMNERRLPGTNCAKFVFVRLATGAASNAVNVLVALGRVLRKVNARSKHA